MREEIEDIITLWDPRSGWVDGEKSVSECTEETLTCQSDKERVRENVRYVVIFASFLRFSSQNKLKLAQSLSLKTRFYIDK